VTLPSHASTSQELPILADRLLVAFVSVVSVPILTITSVSTCRGRGRAAFSSMLLAVVTDFTASLTGLLALDILVLLPASSAVFALYPVSLQCYLIADLALRSVALPHVLEYPQHSAFYALLRSVRA
jgi:hypothetical protein